MKPAGYVEELERLVWNYIDVMEDYSAGFPITNPDHPHHDDWVAATTALKARSDYSDHQNLEEGWAIFECSGSNNGLYQLCASDEEEVLESDEAAWRLVLQRASYGSAQHMAALTFIEIYSPIEWDSMKRFSGTAIDRKS